VAFASGYNNATGRGYVYIVNARTGALLQKLDTGVGAPNAQAGLAHLQSFLKDRTDGTADALYGGDLLGNLWRVDVSAPSGSYPAPLRLAQLSNAAGQALPVTSRPHVMVQPQTLRRFVTVGTGRLLDASDVGSTAVQRFYSILDGTLARPSTAADLPAGWTFPLDNSRLQQVTDPTAPAAVDYATRRGWFLDLGTVSDAGWRVVEEPKSFNGVVAFSAIRSPPVVAPCSVQGFESRVYALDAGSASSRLRPLGGLGSAFVRYSAPVEGAITDLRFVSVAGRVRLLAGGDTGSVADVPGEFGGAGGARLINWREIRAGP
jgi:type IV pilus assembly protein PilY1